jgi:hypothetical protein
MRTETSISRSDLLRFLTEACELEHGLACSYLYAAMSLRQQPEGDKLPADQLLQVRQWASQVYFVASQEMLHLAQAWNLLTALGGTPYYLRPNFPQNTRYYPLHMRLALEPYGVPSLTRFIGYEKPAQLQEEHLFADELAKPRAADAANDFRTIGELYDLIESGIENLPNAIVGDPASQVGPDLVDFPDIVRIVDVGSARKAVQLITHQGEGTDIDRSDCHFGIFLKLLEGLKEQQRHNPQFSPAYPCITNPAVNTSPEYGAPDATLIQNNYSREVAKLFDSLYSLMLRMLGYTFSPCGSADLRAAFGQSAILMMVTVLKPLGEALAALPATDHSPDATAGPPFGLTRHVVLPVDSNSARAVVNERLAELTSLTSRLSSASSAPILLSRAESALRRIAGVDAVDAASLASNHAGTR